MGDDLKFSILFYIWDGIFIYFCEEHDFVLMTIVFKIKRSRSSLLYIFRMQKIEYLGQWIRNCGQITGFKFIDSIGHRQLILDFKRLKTS